MCIGAQNQYFGRLGRHEQTIYTDPFWQSTLKVAISSVPHHGLHNR